MWTAYIISGHVAVRDFHSSIGLMLEIFRKVLVASLVVALCILMWLYLLIQRAILLSSSSMYKFVQFAVEIRYILVCTFIHETGLSHDLLHCKVLINFFVQELGLILRALT